MGPGRTTAFPTFPDHNQTIVQPSVGHFTDDNGDGVVGAGDIPDVAAIFWMAVTSSWVWGTHVLRLLSGDGTTEHWSVEGIRGPDWDFDGQGAPSGMSMAMACRKWSLRPEVREPLPVSTGHPGGVQPRRDFACERAAYGRHPVGCGRETRLETSVPTLVDINQDGVVEIMLGTGIYDGRDGTPWEMPEDWADTMIPIVVDLDKDGRHEVITRGGIHEQDLTLRCTFGWLAYYPAAADMDGDGDGEVVLTGGGGIEIFDDQCRLQQHTYIGDSGTGGPATIADYDGDGQPEIGVAAPGTTSCTSPTCPRRGHAGAGLHVQPDRFERL